MAKKTYRVKGKVKFHGTKPGDTFTAELNEAAEKRAIARGSISVVQKKDSDGESQSK